jgi:hypothetical protein
VQDEVGYGIANVRHGPAVVLSAAKDLMAFQQARR